MTKFTKKSKLSLKKLNKKQNLSLNGSLRVSLGLNRSKNTQLTSRQRLDALVARHDRSDSTLVERITKAAIFVGLLFLGYRIWAVAGYPALPQIRVYALDEAEALLKALVENCARNYQHGTWTPEEAEELGRAILESLDWFDRTNVDHTPFDPEWFEMHHEAAKVLYQMLREGYVDSLKQIIAEKSELLGVVFTTTSAVVVHRWSFFLNAATALNMLSQRNSFSARSNLHCSASQNTSHVVALFGFLCRVGLTLWLNREGILATIRIALAAVEWCWTHRYWCWSSRGQVWGAWRWVGEELRLAVLFILRDCWVNRERYAGSLSADLFVLRERWRGRMNRRFLRRALPRLVAHMLQQRGGLLLLHLVEVASLYIRSAWTRRHSFRPWCLANPWFWTFIVNLIISWVWAYGTSPNLPYSLLSSTDEFLSCDSFRNVWEDLLNYQPNFTADWIFDVLDGIASVLREILSTISPRPVECAPKEDKDVPKGPSGARDQADAPSQTPSAYAPNEADAPPQTSVDDTAEAPVPDWRMGPIDLATLRREMGNPAVSRRLWVYNGENAPFYGPYIEARPPSDWRRIWTITEEVDVPVFTRWAGPGPLYIYDGALGSYRFAQPPTNSGNPFENPIVPITDFFHIGGCRIHTLVGNPLHRYATAGEMYLSPQQYADYDATPEDKRSAFIENIVKARYIDPKKSFVYREVEGRASRYIQHVFPPQDQPKQFELLNTWMKAPGGLAKTLYELQLQMVHSAFMPGGKQIHNDLFPSEKFGWKLKAKYGLPYLSPAAKKAAKSAASVDPEK